MKPALALVPLVAAALAIPLLAPVRAAEPALLARGEYLVERVGMCADCHSPRDRMGQFIKTDWLGGAPIGFTPAAPMPAWAEIAPPIAGLPAGYTAAQLAAFLETGMRPDGSSPRPPMPPYRFSAADAQAVAAYLKSLRTP